MLKNLIKTSKFLVVSMLFFMLKGPIPIKIHFFGLKKETNYKTAGDINEN
jgi:hypothetical protein